MLGIDRRYAQIAWSFASVGLLLWGLFIVRKTLLLFVLALMFSYLLFPLVTLIQRKFTKGARLPALLAPFIGIPLLLVGLGLLLRPSVKADMQQLRKQVNDPTFQSSVQRWHVLGIPIGQEIADASNVAQIKKAVLDAMPEIRVIMGRAGRDISNVILVPLLAFIMLKDGRTISDSIVDAVFHAETGSETKQRRKMVESILLDAHVLILEYMRALVLLCFAVLLVFGVVLSLLKVQYALLMALLAFPLEFIPLIGPALAGVIIIGVCEFNQFPHIGWVITFLIVYRLFQDYVLSPHFMEKSVKLHPLLVIFGVFAGGEIGGVGGIFLSVPIIALARLIYYEYRKQSRHALA